MIQKNAHGKIRILTPAGYERRREIFLRGATITDQQGNYLGWWSENDMNRDIREELKRELRANWQPGFLAADDF